MRATRSTLSLATFSLRSSLQLQQQRTTPSSTVARLAAAAAPRSPSPFLSTPCRLTLTPRATASSSSASLRHYSADPSSSPSDREVAKTRNAVGPFNLRAGLLFLVTGGALLYYFQREKASVDARRAAETAHAKLGRPRIGGPFSLVTSTSHPFTHEDLLGSFSLVYFGFTNCPDICPEELDKMGEIVDRTTKTFGKGYINPVFVSCDPARDTVEALARYIDDFHPKTVGLTGSFDEVKKACKAYRVYFSTPPDADPNGDYLVDHSIFFYLMDPEGKFVDAFGRSVGPQETGDKVEGYVRQWIDAGLDIKEADAMDKVQSDGRPKVDQAQSRQHAAKP